MCPCLCLPVYEHLFIYSFYFDVFFMFSRLNVEAQAITFLQ